MLHPLSNQLREGTKDSHRLAERAPFIQRFFRGQLSREEYRTFLLQLYHIYTALEENQERYQNHEVFGPVIFPELCRKDALVQDLNFYFGDSSWQQLPPTEATQAYIQRIRELGAGWVEGLVAHHYTRYLGDLSGGQALKKIVAKTFELPTSEGLAFYEFDDIPDHAEFKENYRARLDVLPLDSAAAEKIVDEANRAFDLNRAVFESIGA